MLPTLNEAENLHVLLPQLANALSDYDWHAVVVDDGSTDGTQEVVEKFAKETGRASLIERGARLGLGSAIKLGMRVCVEYGAEVTVVMDADLQHPPEVVPRLVDAVLGGSDIAIASRYVGGGGVQGWSLLRLMISKGATYLARLLLPWVRGIRDPVSGFFAVSNARAREVLPYLNESAGYKIILEMLTLMSARFGDLRVTEVPYVFRSRLYGESKLSVGELWRYAWLVIRLSNYSPFKYIVALVVAALIGYSIFNSLSINPILRNLLSLESSLMASLTIYALLMGLKPRLKHYAKYHLVKYGSVLLKMALMPYMPIYVVLALATALQLILTIRVIPITPHVVGIHP